MTSPAVAKRQVSVALTALFLSKEEKKQGQKGGRVSSREARSSPDLVGSSFGVARGEVPVGRKTDHCTLGLLRRREGVSSAQGNERIAREGSSSVSTYEVGSSVVGRVGLGTVRDQVVASCEETEGGQLLLVDGPQRNSRSVRLSWRHSLLSAALMRRAALMLPSG